MSFQIRQLIFAFAMDVPFMVIAALFFIYLVRRAIWKRKKRRGETCPAFCPPSFALGTLMLFTQMFYRPTMSLVVEAREHADVEDDDQGDPDTAAKQLSRQLKRIRRGEDVGDLVLLLNNDLEECP